MATRSQMFQLVGFPDLEIPNLAVDARDTPTNDTDLSRFRNLPGLQHCAAAKRLHRQPVAPPYLNWIGERLRQTLFTYDMGWNDAEETPDADQVLELRRKYRI